MGKKDPPREDLTTVVVIAYQNGFAMKPCTHNNYKEGQIFFSSKEYALGYSNGNIIYYTVAAYKFRRVKNEPAKMQGLVNYMKQHKDRYPGIHHMNIYGGVSRRHLITLTIPDWTG